eukprot:Amastigsp_a339332_513.p5 type:complete len:117 gc:universal Amastigsp_a339332_513:1619-1269(-)
MVADGDRRAHQRFDRPDCLVRVAPVRLCGELAVLCRPCVDIRGSLRRHLCGHSRRRPAHRARPARAVQDQHGCAALGARHHRARRLDRQSPSRDRRPVQCRQAHDRVRAAHPVHGR